jgi:hypothetical protein
LSKAVCVSSKGGNERPKPHCGQQGAVTVNVPVLVTVMVVVADMEI